MDFNTIKKNLTKDFSNLKHIKLALIGDSATQLFVKALKGYGFTEGFNLEIFEADYDQIERQIFDTGSELYEYNPDFIIVFHCTNKLIQKFYKQAENSKTSFASNHLNYVEDAYETINANLKSKIIFLNYNELDNREFGNYSNKLAASFLYQLRKINYGLMELAETKKNLFICDVAYLTAQTGNQNAIDDKFYINATIVFQPDFFVTISKNIVDIIKVNIGKFKKCLILDLDNTVWGGIIGDDGVEKIQIGDYKIGKAFSELQSWAKQLKERGIILAICSKNTESIAKEPFEKHPEMVLRLSDIAVFQANWETKVDNIRHIQEILNIGFDSMVFLDDNPFERNIVIQNIPEITVPDLPEDPSLYLSYLRQLNLFETASVSEADKARTEQYQIEATRKQFQKSFQNETEYLVSLDMQCEVADFNSFNLPRVAQLTQRSNQFNLRTERFSEDDLTKMIASGNYFTYAFSLKDKFGDHGLISTVILEKKDENTLFVNTWIMSCRVLKRGVEEFVLNEIIETAKASNYKLIVGEYLPTPKNDIVKDHYKGIGFTVTENGLWHLGIENLQQKNTFIKKLNNTYV